MTLFEALFLATCWAGIYTFYITLRGEATKFFSAKPKKVKVPVKEIGITDFVSARESLSTKFIEESNMVSEEVTTSSSAVDLAKKLKESRNK